MYSLSKQMISSRRFHRLPPCSRFFSTGAPPPEPARWRIATTAIPIASAVAVVFMAYDLKATANVIARDREARELKDESWLNWLGEMNALMVEHNRISRETLNIEKEIYAGKTGGKAAGEA